MPVPVPVPPDARARDWIASVVHPHGRVVGVRRLKGGITAAVHAVRVQHPGGATTVVVRRWVGTQDAPAEVRREAAVLSQLGLRFAPDLTACRCLCRPPRLPALQRAVVARPGLRRGRLGLGLAGQPGRGRRPRAAQPCGQLQGSRAIRPSTAIVPGQQRICVRPPPGSALAGLDRHGGRLSVEARPSGPCSRGGCLRSDLPAPRLAEPTCLARVAKEGLELLRAIQVALTLGLDARGYPGRYLITDQRQEPGTILHECRGRPPASTSSKISVFGGGCVSHRRTRPPCWTLKVTTPTPSPTRCCALRGWTLKTTKIFGGGTRTRPRRPSAGRAWSDSRPFFAHGRGMCLSQVAGTDQTRYVV